jgi:hypothetical protein
MKKFRVDSSFFETCSFLNTVLNMNHRMGKIPISRPLNDTFHLCADCVPLEMVVRAALLWGKKCEVRGQIVFLTLTTIMEIRALSVLHESTGRSLVWEIYPMRYLWHEQKHQLYCIWNRFHENNHQSSETYYTIQSNEIINNPIFNGMPHCLSKRKVFKLAYLNFVPSKNNSFEQMLACF